MLCSRMCVYMSDHVSCVMVLCLLYVYVSFVHVFGGSLYNVRYVLIMYMCMFSLHVVVSVWCAQYA